MEMMNEISFCSNNGCSRLRLGEDDIQVKSLGRYVLEQVITNCNHDRNSLQCPDIKDGDNS